MERNVVFLPENYRYVIFASKVEGKQAIKTRGLTDVHWKSRWVYMLASYPLFAGQLNKIMLHLKNDTVSLQGAVIWGWPRAGHGSLGHTEVIHSL